MAELRHVPAIAVVLPVYNGGGYLREAVESVLAQDFGDFEFLICDDGSTDGTRDYLRSLAHPRLRVLLNEKNIGWAASFNRLIRESGAPLIHCFSHDDRMHRECLKDAAAFHREHPGLAFSYCAVDYMDSDGCPLPPSAADSTPARIPPWLYAEISVVFGCIAGSVSTIVLVRDALQRHGVFDEQLRVANDWELLTRLSADRDAGFLNQRRVTLRNHAGQMQQQPATLRHHAGEDLPILHRLLPRVRPQFLVTAKRALRWKMHVRQFHSAVTLLLRRRPDLAAQVLQVLKPYDSLPQLGWRWLVVQSLRKTGAVGFFYRKILRIH